MDVLERGPDSPYYRYFDIDWHHPAPDRHEKVMVPFLGSPLETCLDKREIRLTFTDEGFFIAYLETHYPLSIPAYTQLSNALDKHKPQNAITSILSRMVSASPGADFET